MTEETPGQMLDRLGMDGVKWAAEFRKTAMQLGYSDMDEGWLIGWFANAIMAGYDRAPRADLTPSPEVVKELVEALRLIADEAYVTVKANDKGIDHKHLYEGWRKIATTRIDVARAALAKLEGGK